MQKLVDYLSLVRFYHPIGSLLLFFPCSFGILLASTNDKIPWHLLLLFLVGSMIMRSAGCIINDLADKDLDILVDRTKNRPLAKKSISILSSLILLFFLCLLGAMILFSLKKTAILAGLCAIPLVILYPFMKRLTNYPQAFLGITFSIGALVGYAAVKDSLSISAFVLYIACCFWTLGYDTIYAYQDKEDDINAGIKSTAITFSKNPKLPLYSVYSLMVSLLIYIGVDNDFSSLFFFFVFLGLIQLIWQVYFFDPNSPHSCLKYFKSNAYLGLLILCAFALA